VPDTRVWIGRNRNQTTSYFQGKKLGNRAAEPIRSTILSEGHVTTIVLGHFLIQVLTIRRDTVRDVTLHSKPGPWDRRGLIQIWPPLAATEWPPEFSFSGETELDALAGRFAVPVASARDVLHRFPPVTS
jgi:hypothetical protein